MGGHLIRALPFYQKKLKASAREGVSRFGGVFPWRVKSQPRAQVKQKRTLSQRSPHKELMGACVMGSLLTTQKLVYDRHTAELVHQADSSTGRTPFMVSCSEVHMSLAIYLFERAGSKVTWSTSHTGLTPLIYAARAGHVHICLWLLQVSPRGLLHMCDDEGMGAMHWQPCKAMWTSVPVWRWA